jgi:hypothetical protein
MLRICNEKLKSFWRTVPLKMTLFYFIVLANFVNASGGSET